MSTTNEISENSIVLGNGVTTIVPFAFNYNPKDTDIEVVVTLQDNTDPLLVTETVLVEGADYDIVVVSIPLSITTPSIVLEDPIPEDHNLLIQRKIKNLQRLQYDELSPFPAQVHERLVDRVYMSLSELKNMFKKVPKLGIFSDPDLDIKLPDPVDQMYLKWEGDDGTLVNTSLLEDEIVAELENYADAVGTSTLSQANTYSDAENEALDSSLQAYASNADAVVLATSQAYTDTGLAGKSNVGHTHPLTDLEQSGAIDGQVVVWDNVAGEWQAQTPVSGVTDHGLLSGLADDDHPQYHNDARGDARYYTETETDALLIPKLEAADIANFETTTQLNTRDTNNRARANHTGTQALSTLSQSGATTNQVAQWNGTSWVPATASGGVSDGDKGDVTVSGTGATWTIDNNVVTNAKASDMPALTLKGNDTGLTADPKDLTVADAKTLLAVEPTDLVNTQTNPYNRPHESKTIAYDDVGTGGIQIRAVSPMMARTAHISWWIPNLSSPTLNMAGMANVVLQGTSTGKTPNNQPFDVAKAIPRIGYRITTAATTAIASWRSNSNNYYMSGQGSYMLSAFTSCFIFGPDTGLAASTAGTMRCFAGFTNATGTPSDVNPNAIGAQVVGVGARNTDTNWHVFVRASAVDTQIIDTGIAKAMSAEDTDMYQLIIESLGGRLGGGVRITFRELGTNSIANEYTTVISSGDLPADNQLLSPRVQYSVGGTSSVIGVSIAKFYSEQYYGAYGYL